MPGTAATPEIRTSAWERLGLRPAWALPPLTEIVFVSVLLWIVAGSNPSALLADADTGWHIRTGQWILNEGRVPSSDLFSFSRPGAEWFAWEWGSDVLFALLFRMGGLPGVVLLAAVLIAATSAALFHFLLWNKANVIVAVLILWTAASAATVHWLARPHLFTYLLFILSLWILESDRRHPARRVWCLVPLSALWTNLHGGFLALTGAVMVYCAGSLLGRDWKKARRCAWVAGAVLAATLLNPYTYRLHLHIVRYLGSSFIRNQVEEFRSPSFRGEGMLAFEALLLAGLLVVPRLWRRREYAPALLLIGLAHASLGSVRHVLLYALAAAPILAGEASEALQRSDNGWLSALAAVGPSAENPGRPRRWLPFWAFGAVGLAAALFHSGNPRWQADFPAQKFPQAALQAAEEKLLGRRIFTSDQWADYLIYRYYPRVKVFMDGRSDFYGEAVGRQYLDAMMARHSWEEIFNRNGFDVALLPAGWPLATVLKAHPGWRLEYDDGQALVLRRVMGAS